MRSGSTNAARARWLANSSWLWWTLSRSRRRSSGWAAKNAELDGRMVDVTRLDPSIAGAAGGSGLVTTVQDLARFWDALLRGRLFSHRATLKGMLTFGPTPGEVTSGYGLGVEQYTVPGGI